MQAEFQCAGCGEWNETVVDASAGSRQSYVEDCQVCCKPTFCIFPGTAAQVNISSVRNWNKKTVAATEADQVWNGSSPRARTKVLKE